MAVCGMPSIRNCRGFYKLIQFLDSTNSSGSRVHKKCLPKVYMYSSKSVLMSPRFLTSTSPTRVLDLYMIAAWCSHPQY
jgi:hypothetical protein